MITGLLVLILILGFIVYAIYRWAPIPNGFKVAAYIVCMLAVIFAAMRTFGIALP
jgi:hypothetical protein